MPERSLPSRIVRLRARRAELAKQHKSTQALDREQVKLMLKQLRAEGKAERKKAS